MQYNLEERTLKFSKDLISLLKKIKLNIINKPLISQIIRSATSIGSNYREANGAVSKKDFHNKIHICKKECKETLYWIEIIAHTEPNHKEELKSAWKEATELTKIFAKIASSSK